MFRFVSIDRFEIAGRGTVYVVENPFECVDLAHLLQGKVEIDGNEYFLKGVEYFRYPEFDEIRAGQKIGLLVVGGSKGQKL